MAGDRGMMKVATHPADVEWADALVLATPAHFGYGSGR